MKLKSATNEPTAILRKMMCLVLLVLLQVAGAEAQVRLGVLGGIHSASVKETNQIPGWDTAVKKYESSRSGVQLGVILEIPVGHKGFFFLPAITYSSKGRQYTRNYDSAEMPATKLVYKKQTLALNYIDIPLNLSYKLPLSANHKNSFFISAGPSVGFYFSGKLSTQSLSYNTNKFTDQSDPLTVGKGPDTYKTLDLGVNARAGFELGNVLLNVYFSQGLTSFYNAPYTGSFHNQLFGASIGIWLTSTAIPKPPPPKDTDKDGIPDARDLCPLQPGTAAWHGCPVPDTDRDGIDDEHDSCKTVPGLARYNGCPIPDADGDGINDEEDKCPHLSGLARYQGCPIPDRDGDGVNDEEDKCPDIAGLAENQGCPVIKKDTPDIRKKLDYTAKNILFNLASNQLTDSSFRALEDLAEILKDHPEWHLTIEGYTDNEGTPERNHLLSQKRALVVKDFLVKNGVLEKNLTATGLGQNNPIADNSTAKGRAANRRVELKLSPQK
ncbi:OmpA family protein [Flavitalea flava]